MKGPFALVAAFLTAASLLAVSPHASYAQAVDPVAQLRELNEAVEDAARAASAGDLKTASTLFTQFRAGWANTEDGVRERSLDRYEAIEDAIGKASAAFRQNDAAKVVSALEELGAADEAFLAGGYAQAATKAAPAETSIEALLAELGEARDALGRKDMEKAREAFGSFRRLWPAAEAKVRVRSAEAYASTEDSMPDVQALLDRGDAAGAEQLLGAMVADLEPLTGEAARYGVFDAATLLLREGLEALLIIAALLAVVRRSAQGRQQGWVWAGALAGLLASLAVAVALTVIFRGVETGGNRELLEGGTALVAAAMLFYVSYWLHRKSHLGAWHEYLNAKTSAALATGRLFSLGLLAFLAVFREGAETVLFYLGMAPSIQPQDLFLGLGVAVLVLVVIGVLVIQVGVRIPLRPFFLVTSALIFYLGFKFIGTGVHALQVAGALPASPTPFLLNVDLFGLFPTWETLVPQLALIIAAALLVAYTHRGQRRQATAG